MRDTSYRLLFSTAACYWPGLARAHIRCHLWRACCALLFFVVIKFTRFVIHFSVRLVVRVVF